MASTKLTAERLVPLKARFGCSSCGAAYGQRIKAKRRLSDANGNTLPILPAGTDAWVELHVVSDHGDAGHGVRTITDKCRPLNRRADLAVFDLVSLGTREHEFAGRDVDLAAAELHRIDTVLDRAKDLFRLMLAAEHVGVGHARHHAAREGLPPAVTRRRHSHEAGVHAVLHETFQNSVLNQNGA